MKKILLILLLLVALQSNAQFDSTQRALIGKFMEMREGIFQKQADFINKNDSLFIQFLRNSWKSVQIMQGLQKTDKKPIEQPVLKTIPKQEKVEMIEIDTTQLVALDDDEGDKDDKQQLHEDTATGYNAQTVLQKFSFFGNTEKVYDWPQIKPTLKGIQEEFIVDFYEGIAKQNAYWLNDIALLEKLRSKYMLNDWGFYQLVKYASISLFNNINEQRLFSWYVLLKNGFDVKVGYDQTEIFLMLPSIHKIYGRQYYIGDEAIYYIADISKSKISNLKTYDVKYPGSNKLFDFQLINHPTFDGQPIQKNISFKGKTSSFVFEKGELELLSTYPQCDLKLYFKCGIKSENQTGLDELILPHIKDKSDREILDVLIDFIQSTIEYATDEEQFGKERYLYAEESLYYPKNDCEDRTIFLSFLVKRYTGLDNIALDFPGHVALAVNLPNAGNGNFIHYKGGKYLICDPTYINAKSGMVPDQYKTMKAKIVTYN